MISSSSFLIYNHDVAHHTTGAKLYTKHNANSAAPFVSTENRDELFSILKVTWFNVSCWLRRRPKFVSIWENRVRNHFARTYLAAHHTLCIFYNQQDNAILLMQSGLSRNGASRVSKAINQRSWLVGSGNWTVWIKQWW